MLNLEGFTVQRKCHFTAIFKDKAPHDQRNHIIYKINCPGCNVCYIGKTEKCLITRITEHGTKETEPTFKHLLECEMFKDCCWLYSLSSLLNKDEHGDISFTRHILMSFYKIMKY